MMFVRPGSRESGENGEEHPMEKSPLAGAIEVAGTTAIEAGCVE